MTDADDRLLPALPSAVVVFEAGLFFFWLSFIEIENFQLLAHFSLDLAQFFFPDYQQTISRRLAKPEFASEASLENRSNQFSSSTEAKGLAHNPVVSPKRIFNLTAGGVKP